MDKCKILFIFLMTNLILCYNWSEALLVNNYTELTINTLDGNSIEDNYQSSDECVRNPDEYLTTPQIVRRHGYRSESHVVETADGYLLTLHRIPTNVNNKTGKQPVFLQHGLFGCSADFVISDNRSLAFILADLGYDVWLGNARGNIYSKAHVSLLPNTAQFWNFSFHEMGVYDLPASLSYISNITNREGEIIYIGHSMGTTIFYVFASILPEFAKNNVKMMVGLGPVAYMTHIKSSIRYLAPFVNDLQWISKVLGVKDFFPNGKVLEFLNYDCKLLNKKKEICESIIFAIYGFDKDQIDEKMLPVILGHNPAGCSTKTVLHYVQEIYHNGSFMQYDYGTLGNLIEYGTPTPPLYNLSKIAVPTYFMYADNDELVNPIDVHRLALKVSNNIGLYEVPLETFNHVDFLWAKDVLKLVYRNLTDTIKEYSLDE